jgi:hypothetical protein
MNQLLFVLFTAGTFLTTGCTSNDSKTQTKTNMEETTVQTPQGNAPAKPVTSTEEKATADLCNCMNDALRDMNPKIRAIILKAGKSDNPELTLQKELLSASSTEEAQSLAQEFQQFQENNKVENCSDEIKKKYNFDEKDKATRDKLVKAAAENGNCELVYALLKISEQQIEKGTDGSAGQ